MRLLLPAIGLLLASIVQEDIRPLADPHDFERWFAHVDADPAEISWKTGIDWHQAFGPALARAARDDRPILLYLATGDPQGCT
ncbi:hypothetical protein Pla163_24050 [Planctomycetes bacterium Pla163]|uniref:Uncharacterized protein n=1 Tax=Rohdeia mirabilis TaxID=2528008 RepID=A0A518D1D2_9BACT|nr:hypothetical protein Pla163_24050 [Planctomycetes bacterium Pla163]